MKKAVLYSLREQYLYFIVCSMIGWVYEVGLGLIKEEGFVNRGFMFGPWLPVYGVGGLIILFLMSRILGSRVKNKAIKILITFVAITLLAMFVELAASYIIDITGGNFKTLWNYSDRKFNFQGRIALWPGIKFGIIGVLVMYCLKPLLDKLFRSKYLKAINIGIICCAAIFFSDVIARIWLGSNFVGK